MDEVFGLHNILAMSFLWKEVRMMVHIIPRIIRDGHIFHDVLIKVEYGKTRARKTT